MANNYNYSYDDMIRMQQDAIRRVKEMQRVSNQNMQGERPRQQNRQGGRQTQPNHQEKHHAHTGEQGTSHPHGAAHIPNGHEQPHQEKPDEHEKDPSPDEEEESESSTLLKGILDRLGLDSEKALLMVMILILLNDGADKKLILALAYLLI